MSSTCAEPNEHAGSGPDSEPQAIASILRKTTRIPLYCHPNSWSRTHLLLLRVQGLDEVHPLDHVIGSSVASACANPSDTALQGAVDELSLPPEGSLLHNTLNLIEGEAHDDTKWVEQLVSELCDGWLYRLWGKIRGFPMEVIRAARRYLLRYLFFCPCFIYDFKLSMLTFLIC